MLGQLECLHAETETDIITSTCNAALPDTTLEVLLQSLVLE